MSDLTLQAKPTEETLRRARHEVADNPELHALFAKPEDVNWLADNLSVRLCALWGGRDYGEAWNVSLYLANEFFQNRAAPIVVTDQVTGRAIAHLPAEAIWQPPATARESGQIVQPLPRLRPDIESALTLVHHDNARAQHELARRAETDSHQRDQRILTAAGRESIHVRAYEKAAQQFTKQVEGRLHGTVLLGHGTRSVTLVANSSMRMPDLASMNLAFSFESWLTQSLVQHWIQAVAGLIVESARHSDIPLRSWVNASPVPIMWIGNPEQVRQVQIDYPSHGFYWGYGLVGVRGSAFAIEAMPGASGASLNVTQDVIHETWRIEAYLPVRVTRLDGEIEAFNLEMPLQEFRGELVQD